MKKIYETPEIGVKKLMMERIMDAGDPYAIIDVSEDHSVGYGEDEN